MVSSGLLQAYIAIGVSAVIPIYYGSHASVKTPKKLKKAIKESKSAEEQAVLEDEDDDFDDIDRLTAGDAWLFPILGSATLLTLFLAFKYLNKDLINKILSSYFALIGSLAVARTGVYFVKNVFIPKIYPTLEKSHLTLRKGPSSWLDVKFTNLHVLLTLATCGLTGYHLYTNNWVAANIIALAFCFNAISLIKIDSFKTGIILLSGLFLYDIYWVFFSKKQFGQSVMVAVATNFEAPIKIVYPKDGFFQSVLDMTMLGLGDIVVPGIFISLALRFDYSQAIEKAKKAGKSLGELPTPKQKYKKPYFAAVLLSYILGLVTTIVVMHTFRAAQPALLYLSPACIFSVLLLAAARGEMNDLWTYTEESEDSEKRKDDEDESDGETSDDEGNAGASKAEHTVTSGNGKPLEIKDEEVLNGQAGDAAALKRRTTRSTAKLAEPQVL